MKILLANPNTSQSVTDRIAEVARAAASPGTEIVAVTGTVGVPYIATRADAAVAGRTTLELMAEHAAGCDAAIVAAFGDPGLGGARELLAIPVVGMAEAAMLTACMLGRRFAIVTFSADLGPWYRECVEYNGLTARLASIRCLDGAFADIASVQHEKEDLLVDLCARAIVRRRKPKLRQHPRRRAFPGWRRHPCRQPRAGAPRRRRSRRCPPSRNARRAQAAKGDRWQLLNYPSRNLLSAFHRL